MDREQRYSTGPDPHKGSEGAVLAVVVVASSTRAAANDTSGVIVAERLVAAGIDVANRVVVDDDVDGIRGAVRVAIESGARLVIVTGGTGFSPRDLTPEALEPLFDRPIPGFGELFRALSHAEIGAAAMLSRATAGVAGRAVVFGVPGSEKGARLAVDALIAPVLRHLIGQIDKTETQVTKALALPTVVPKLPQSVANNVAVMGYLQAAPQRASVSEDGRDWSVFAWPNEGSGKVLWVGAEVAGWPEIVAKHRRGTGTVVPGGCLDPVDVAAVAGRPSPIHGAVIAVEGARVWQRDGEKTASWDGHRVVDAGTPKQLLATLVLGWASR